ncbi:Hypothetical predicted protein [Paramuricea clavata]|uniref:Uncharacterized protein n=1 Tax=Paramuricea clavata TaxID=317549 RepID=A0A6S7KNQ4_PARCT|nr:Hypothetical predicted protein [Paramuricea clavata]
MALEKGQVFIEEGLRDMTIEDLQEFSNIFASEFNNSDIHDRVLCFQIIENETKVVDSEDEYESRCESETGSNLHVLSGDVFSTEYEDQPVEVKDNSCEMTSIDGNMFLNYKLMAIMGI